MYKLLILSFTLALFTLPSTGQEKERIVLIETSMGNLKAKLYNDTPIHRDNFIELAKSGQYDGTLFYRVIKDFIIQGGSADSRNAVAGQELGYGREITIDAPRQPDETNPLKKSDISQFYFTVGRKYPPEELEHIEKSVNVPIKRAIQNKYYTPEKKAILDSLKAQKNVPEFRKIANKIKADIARDWENNTEKLFMDEAKKQAYTTEGGAHSLDGEYTVFGELIEGFDILDKIAALQTDKKNRPLKDVRIIRVKIIE